MPHVYSLPTRVCSLQGRYTPLLYATFKSSPSPGIVEALVKAKADVNATNKVRHLEDSRCATCTLIAQLVCVRCSTAPLP